MKRHIPNFITCLNLLTGALGCIEIIGGDFRQAIVFVAIAGAFDFFDGFAARMLRVKSDIGKELDSLADMVSFGLLPALFMMKLMDESEVGYTGYVGLAIGVFSALRLAKFNLDTRQTDEFIGLPVPANTLFLTSLVYLPFGLPLWALIGLTGLSCFLLVSPLHLLALKFSSFGWRGNELRFSFLIISILLLGIPQLSGLPFIIPAYLLVSLAGNFFVKKSI